MESLSDIWVLMRKEWRVLLGDKVMIMLLVYAFGFAVYLAGSGQHGSGGIRNASIAIVDLDQSGLAERFAAALRRPYFLPAKHMGESSIDKAMANGEITFALQLPPHFTADLIKGRQPQLELFVDATAMTQAFVGAGYIETVVRDEISDYLRGRIPQSENLPGINIRMRFNQTGDESYFGGLMELAQMITMIGVILTGTAVLREKERGTLEHLLVLPVRASSILLSKIFANVTVMLVCIVLSLYFVVENWLGIPFNGSIPLYLTGAGIYMFSATAIGVFLALAVRSTQEFGLLCLVVVMPMLILSGVMTPIENMPWFLRAMMSVLPSPHFVKFTADVGFRGADFAIVWPALLKMGGIGLGFTAAAVALFRLSVARVTS